jgi:hypothetical protein
MTTMSVARFATISLTLVVLVGCHRPSGKDRYVPAGAAARRALQESLDAWKDGTAASTEPKSPRVEFEDIRRQRGRRLLSYEIVGEVSGEDGRWFEVALELDQPAERVQTRYIVIGINPLLVSRQEDYENMLRWDHDMTPANNSAKSKTP